MTGRDPLAGMPDDIRADFEMANRQLREAYFNWFAKRPNKAAAHRDTWPAFRAGWTNFAAAVARLTG